MTSAARSSKPTVLDLAAALAAGQATSRDLVDAALARISRVSLPDVGQAGGALQQLAKE